jgi:hypothetical protein
VTVLPRVLMGSVARFIDRTPRAVVDAPVHITVHAVCDDRDVARVRALLTHALSGPSIELLHVHADAAAAGTTALEATAAVTGAVTTPLGQVLTLVWLDPGVHSINWDLRPEETAAPEPAAA